MFGQKLKYWLDGEKEKPILALIQCNGKVSNTSKTWHWKIYSSKDELLISALSSLVSAMLE